MGVSPTNLPFHQMALLSYRLGLGKAVLALAVLVMCIGSALSYQLLPRRGMASHSITNATEEFLLAHNKARAAVGVAPLRWSSELAGKASLLARYQRNENNCALASMDPGKYGENQHWAGWQISAGDAVEDWVAEKQFYSYANNSCEPSHKCGVYTQVVWKESVEVGCGQAVCKGPLTLTICYYFPPGNVVGEKPY